VHTVGLPVAPQVKGWAMLNSLKSSLGGKGGRRPLAHLSWVTSGVIRHTV
jgi:hypothetical protein